LKRSAPAAPLLGLAAALILGLTACGREGGKPSDRTGAPTAAPASVPAPGPTAAPEKGPSPWPEAAGPEGRARAAIAVFEERGRREDLLAAFGETGAQARGIWREALPGLAVAAVGTPEWEAFLADLLLASPEGVVPDDPERRAALDRARSLIDRGRAEEAREAVKGLASPIDGEALLVRCFADVLEGSPAEGAETLGLAAAGGGPPEAMKAAAGRWLLLCGPPGKAGAPRGLVLLARGDDPAEALRELDAAGGEEDLAARWARFGLLLLAKRFEDAKALLATLGPDADPDARIARGWLAAQAGNLPEAASEFVAAAGADPGDVLAHWNLAALSPRGRIPRETLEGLLARIEEEVFRPRPALLPLGRIFAPPAHAEVLALSLLDLARGREREGAPEETVARLIALARAAGPGVPAPAVFLSELRLRAGDAAGAAAVLGEAYGPEAAADPGCRLRYAAALRLAGETARAAEVFPPPEEPVGEAILAAFRAPEGAAPPAADPAVPAPPVTAATILAGLRAGQPVAFDYPDVGAAGAVCRKLAAFAFAPGYGFLVRDPDPAGRFLVTTAELGGATGGAGEGISPAVVSFEEAREALRGDEPEKLSAITAGRTGPAFQALRAEGLLLTGEAGLAVQETAPLLDPPPWVPASPVADRMRVIARFAIDPAETVLAKVSELRAAWPDYLPLLEDACALCRQVGRPREALAALRELVRRDPGFATAPRCVRVRGAVVAAVAAGAATAAELEDLLSEDVAARKLAVRAAAGLPPPEATGLLVRLASDVEAEVRAASVRYLGEGDFRGGVEAVRTACADPSSLVRGAAARSIRLLLGRESVRELLPLLADAESYPRAVAGREVAAAAGREFGYDAEAPEPERAEAIRRVEAWLRER
jgi:tetratricopeptide (TPR) repeat protein